VNLMGFFPAIDYSFVVSFRLSAFSFQQKLKIEPHKLVGHARNGYWHLSRRAF
jgi:hypothetical protein